MGEKNTKGNAIGCPASNSVCLRRRKRREKRQMLGGQPNRRKLDEQEKATQPQHSPMALGVMDLAKANSLSDLQALVERGKAAQSLLHVFEQIDSEGHNLEEVRESLLNLQADSSVKIDDALMIAVLREAADEDWDVSLSRHGEPLCRRVHVGDRKPLLAGQSQRKTDSSGAFGSKRRSLD